MRSIMSAGALLLSPILCLGQANVADNCFAAPANSAAAPLIRAAASAQFATVRQCIVNNNSDCAEAALDEIDEGALNEDEQAVFWLARGDTESLQGSSRRARRDYRRVIIQRDGNRQLALAAIERTAIRFVEDENYDNALDTLEAVVCGEWTAELVYLKARAQFAEGDFSAARDTVMIAITHVVRSSKPVPELWHALADASTQRAEEAEDIVCTTEESAGSYIPKRVCRTRAQRQTDAGSATDVLSGESAILVIDQGF